MSWERAVELRNQFHYNFPGQRLSDVTIMAFSEFVVTHCNTEQERVFVLALWAANMNDRPIPNL